MTSPLHIKTSNDTSENGAFRKDHSAAGDLCIAESVRALDLNAKKPTPSPAKSRFERAGAWLICANASIACGIALFAFSTWWWWQDWRIGAGSDTIPMAPSPAL